MYETFNPPSNKCPKCKTLMNDNGYSKQSNGTFNTFECPNCFFQIKTRMELYGRKW